MILNGKTQPRICGEQTENARFLPLVDYQNEEEDWIVLYGHGQLIPHVVEGEEVQKYSPWP